MRWNKGSLSALFSCVFVLTQVAGALAHSALDAQLADLDRRLRVEGESCELFMARGDLHRLHRDWRAALADFDRAESLDPERFEVEYFRAKVHLDSGRQEQAEAHLRRLLDQPPGRLDRWRGPAHLLLAKVLSRSGRPLAAADQYDQAIALLERPRPQVYVDRARELRAAGHPFLERAVQGLDEGLARLGSLVTLEQLALELELEGRAYEAALTRVGRLLRDASRTETWLVRKGEILERAGRPSEATATFEAAWEAWLRVPAGRRLSRAMVSLERRIHAGRERLSGRGEAGR